MEMGDSGDKNVVYCTEEELFKGFVGGVGLLVEPGSIGVCLADGDDLCSYLA